MIGLAITLVVLFWGASYINEEIDKHRNGVSRLLATVATDLVLPPGRGVTRETMTPVEQDKAVEKLRERLERGTQS